MCSYILKTDKQMIDKVLGKFFRGTDSTINCKKCNYEFNIVINWAPIKEDLKCIE